MEANRKRDYQTFNPRYYLRWLPLGGKYYKYEAIGTVGFEMALIERAKKEAAVLQEPRVETVRKEAEKPKTLEEFRTAFLLDKRTTLKKDGTPLDPEAICDTRLTRGAWRSIRVGIPDRSREPAS
jgi:hypothetical protein